MTAVQGGTSGVANHARARGGVSCVAQPGHRPLRGAPWQIRTSRWRVGVEISRQAAVLLWVSASRPKKDQEGDRDDNLKETIQQLVVQGRWAIWATAAARRNLPRRPGGEDARPAPEALRLGIRVHRRKGTSSGRADDQHRLPAPARPADHSGVLGSRAQPPDQRSQGARLQQKAEPPEQRGKAE